MSFKKFLRSGQGQATIEYLMLSVLLAAIVWLGFKKFDDKSFFRQMKEDRLQSFYGDASERINCAGPQERVTPGVMN